MSDYWSGLRGLRTPRALTDPVTPVAVGGAYTAAIEAVGLVNSVVRGAIQPLVNAEAEAQAWDSVTRDADGKLQVQPRFEFEEQDKAYNAAQSAAYMSQMTLDMRRQFSDLRKDPAVATDPAAFRVAAEGILKGNMEGAPAAYRGAVQSLYSQELLRNEQDITDKAERLALVRQKSAIDANIEMLTNDWFAIAMNGGAMSADGVQAFSRLQSAMHQLDNPLFGVAPEEVQLRLDRAMSFGKVFAFEAQIQGIYRAAGPEAAEAAVNRFLADPSLELDASAIRSFKSSMVSDIHQMHALDVQAATAARVAQNSAQVDNLNLLQIDIDNFQNYGIGDPAEIQQRMKTMLGNGSIDIGGYQVANKSLGGAVRVGLEKQAEVTARVETVNTHLMNGVLFDPRDEKTRKNVEAWWTVNRSATLGDPVSLVNEATGFAMSTGIIPEQAASLARSNLNTGDPANRAFAARAIVGFQKANANAADTAFSADDVATAQWASEMMANNTPPDVVFETIDKARNVPADVKEQRRAQARGLLDDGTAGKNGRPPGAAYSAFFDEMTRLNGGVPITYDPGSADPVQMTIGRAKQSWQAMFEKQFEITGSDTYAREQANALIRNNYGQTMFGQPVPEAVGTDPASLALRGGNPRVPEMTKGRTLMWRSPELVYAPGQPVDQAHEWITQQLDADLRALYGNVPWLAVPASSLVLAPSLDDVSPSGRPVYSVLLPDGQPVVGPDGKAIVWWPDSDAQAKVVAADVAARQALITAQSVESRRMQAARMTPGATSESIAKAGAHVMED